MYVRSREVSDACAQSLYLDKGETAVEGYAGWSTGPFSTGAEFLGSVGLNGIVDVGVGIARYTYTFEDGSKSSFTEYAPLVRYFAVKQQSGAPISLSINGQVFVDDYGTSDKGSYGKIGTTVYRDVKVTDGFSLQPFLGFSFVAESRWSQAGSPFTPKVSVLYPQITQISICEICGYNLSEVLVA